MPTVKIHRSFRSVDRHISMDLQQLCFELQHTPQMQAKKSIRHAANFIPREDTSAEARYALPGDDCAAIATDSGYELLAMEGMLPDFVTNDPQAAGLSAVMANVSDIAAMGGRAKAVVNAFWHKDADKSETLLRSVRQACDLFGVIFAGGHSSIHRDYAPNLAVAILGHANNLLSCHHIKPGQRLFLLTDLTGRWHGQHAYWDCTYGKTPAQIKQQWQVPAELADHQLVVAAKDVSNGGLLGTLLMMLELTQCGASLDLNALPLPGADLLRWLTAFQSFGFLLTADANKTSELLGFFKNSHLTCCPIGKINGDGKIRLNYLGQQAKFWDFKVEALTNMNYSTTENPDYARG